MAEILPFFAVPFGFAKLENCAPLNQELRTLFLARSAEGGEHANPRPLTQRNPQVFESNFGLFRSNERCLQQLKEFCWRHLIKFVCDLNGYDDAMRSRLLIYSDAWFHVTRRGGFFGLHNHPNASWSGVYCVDPGQRGSGLLTFLNPMLASSMYLDAANASLRGAFASGVRQIDLEPGQLVLFPSWVLHDVKPYEGDGERITVAFNCWFQLTDGSVLAESRVDDLRARRDLHARRAAGLELDHSQHDAVGRDRVGRLRRRVLRHAVDASVSGDEQDVER